jgi:phosphoribosylamine--glycine ligase
MGAYSPVPCADPALEREILDRIVAPVVAGMRAEGHPYRGVLFCGLMLAGGEPRVIEFNVRFGDPETQALLLRLESDLVPLLDQAARGRLPAQGADVRLGDPALCVVLASGGYPRAHESGREILGLEAAEQIEGVKLFHAGTARERDRWLTRGGRVLGVGAKGASVAQARERAYAAIERIRFDGAQYRTDIAARALRGA